MSDQHPFIVVSFVSNLFQKFPLKLHLNVIPFNLINFKLKCPVRDDVKYLKIVYEFSFNIENYLCKIIYMQ